MKENCPDELTLSRFFDGELQDDELRVHVAQCSVCQRRMRAYESLNQELTSALRAVPKPQLRWKRSLVGVAAAVLACGLLVQTVYQKVPAETNEPVVLKASTRDGRSYTIKTNGEAILLSLELNGSKASFEKTRSD